MLFVYKLVFGSWFLKCMNNAVALEMTSHFFGKPWTVLISLAIWSKNSWLIKKQIFFIIKSSTNYRYPVCFFLKTNFSWARTFLSHKSAVSREFPALFSIVSRSGKKHETPDRKHVFSPLETLILSAFRAAEFPRSRKIRSTRRRKFSLSSSADFDRNVAKRQSSRLEVGKEEKESKFSNRRKFFKVSFP